MVGEGSMLRLVRWRSGGGKATRCGGHRPGLRLNSQRDKFHRNLVEGKTVQCRLAVWREGRR